MMNEITGGFTSHTQKQRRQAERLVPMTHLAGDRQKRLLIYTHKV